MCWHGFRRTRRVAGACWSGRISTTSGKARAPTLSRAKRGGPIIHYGADDNASGVARMLEIAHYLAREKALGRLAMKRDAIFAAWSGAGLALLGSTHYARRLAGNASAAIAAYLNLDMIGRLDKTLVLQGVASSPEWLGIIERQNSVLRLPIVAESSGYLPTDATSFSARGVPVLSAFTGAHAEYHTPRDTPETLNYAGAAEVARFMAHVARFLLEEPRAPAYAETAVPAPRASRAGLRVYLGTIPDYSAADVTGVKLAGVVPGGPAASAGLQPGDVIVEVGGQKVEDIYDYTYTMQGLRIGEAVELVVMRGGQRVRIAVTPSSREAGGTGRAAATGRRSRRATG